MCIICNTSDMDGILAANNFLLEYKMAQRRMKAAAADLLEVKKNVSPEQARQYDRIHKRMKAIIREWNSVEHLREQHTKAKEGA